MLFIYPLFIDSNLIASSMIYFIQFNFSQNSIRIPRAKVINFKIKNLAVAFPFLGQFKIRQLFFIYLRGLFPPQLNLEPMKRTRCLTLLSALMLGTFSLTAQEQEQEPMDASKPTNFYTLLDHRLEDNSFSGHNIIGYRGKIAYALSEAHLILGEVPILYNTFTKKFGFGDFRAKYFYLPYKNYGEVFAAFGPFIDLFIPTGPAENGLGGGRMVISPGVTAGFIATTWLQIFPSLSYKFGTRRLYGNIPDDPISRFNLDILISLTFEKIFIHLNSAHLLPYNSEEFYHVPNRNHSGVLVTYQFKETMHFSGFFHSSNTIQQLGVGLTMFL